MSFLEGKFWVSGLFLFLLLVAGSVFLAARNERAGGRGPSPSDAGSFGQGVVLGANSNAPTPAGAADAVAPVRSKAAQPFKLTLHSVDWPFLSNGEPAEEWAEFHSAEIGDVTGDGRDDLISVGQTEDPTSPWMLYVYPQLPNGTLGYPKRYPLDQNESFIGLSLADMNNDGVEDVVITRSKSIWLGLSGPAGVLSVVPLSSVVADKKEMVVAAVTLDVDRDGNQDVVGHLQAAYADLYDRSVDRRSRFRITYGDGRGGALRTEDFAVYGLLIDAGTWSEAHESELATSLVVNDLNNDGYADLAMASRRSDMVAQQVPPFISIYINDRRGSFRDPQLIPANILSAENVPVLEYLATGDFNGDGREDLVGTSTGNRATIWTFLQTASGGFSTVPSYGKQTLDFAVALDGVDLDTDGRDDVVIGHSVMATVGYHLQKGGVLLGEVTTSLYTIAFADMRPTGVATGDLNSDGCTDVAVAMRFDGLQVLRGSNCGRRVVTGGVLKPRSRRTPLASPARPAAHRSATPIVRDSSSSQAPVMN